jgi:hypothetical protein
LNLLLFLLLFLASGVALVLGLVSRNRRVAIEEADQRFDEEVHPLVRGEVNAVIEDIMKNLRKVL